MELKHEDIPNASLCFCRHSVAAPCRGPLFSTSRLKSFGVLVMHIKTPLKCFSFNKNETEYCLEALALTPCDSPYRTINRFLAIRLNPKIISYILQGDVFQIQMNLILCISWGRVHKVSTAVRICYTVSQRWPTNTQ
jgi:hypothetical protein